MLGRLFGRARCEVAPVDGHLVSGHELGVDCPCQAPEPEVEEWLDELSPTELATALAHIDRLAERGSQLRMPAGVRFLDLQAGAGEVGQRPGFGDSSRSGSTLDTADYRRSLGDFRRGSASAMQMMPDHLNSIDQYSK